MPTDLCPWLGTEQDREIRHAEPNEGHVCYAQKRAAGLTLDYQAQFCLTSEHQACRFYLEPPPLPPPPVLEEDEDQAGPAQPQLSILRVALWMAALVVAAAVVYYYGSTLLTMPPTPTATVDPGLAPAPTFSATPTSTRAPLAASALPTFEFGEATAAPTPFPGGAVYSLSPDAGAAGWVASDEARGNHLGDSYLYTGVFDGVIYHGVFQFNLSSIPRGATVHAAALELAGLDARRLGDSGVWEVRILARQADEGWSRQTYQDVHNAQVQWSLPPALGAGDLVVGDVNVFDLSREQARDLEQRLLDEHYALSFRIDGPLAGENSVFAWDTGHGAATLGFQPRLLLNVGPPPKTPIPSGSPPPTNTPTPSLTPTPTETPIWVVVTSTPTPENAMTAAAIVARETVWATTTGTATATAEFIATATPQYIVVTSTPTPLNQATAIYERSLATAYVILTGTPTPTPHHLATATPTPTPTPTPVLVWLDEITGTPTPSPTPTPTSTPIPPMPAVLRGKIAFLSDRNGENEPAVYILEPESGRIARLTDRWPYDLAVAQERLSPDGRFAADVRSGERGLQIYVTDLGTELSWAITFGRAVSYDPAWSPNGDLIAYVSQEMGPEGGSDDVFTVHPSGSDKRRLTYNTWEWDKHPSFSPDGAQIVFWSNQTTGRRQLWIMNVDGSERRILLDSPHNDWDPVWIK